MYIVGCDLPSPSHARIHISCFFLSFFLFQIATKMNEELRALHEETKAHMKVRD